MAREVHHPVAVRLFGVTQGVVLVILIVAIILRRRSVKSDSSPTTVRAGDIEFTNAVKQEHPAQTTPQSQAKVKLSLETAFPSWTTQTSPHEILGVHPQASAAAIETAYKKLLKRYHPDRFAHWGGGYQTRAHHIILILQAARDKMLKGKQ
jgi:hypothetical protein